MRVLWSIAALAAFLMLTQPLAAQTPPDPIVKTEGLRQVSPHVYIIPDNSVPLVPNIGFVIGERGILVVDTGLGPRNGSAVLEVAKKLGGSRALYLVTTHFHPEHDLGAQVFPESTTLIRSNDQAKDIAEFGLQLAQVFARRSAINSELLKDADFRKANVTFDRDYALDLGGVKVQLIAMGANHTRGDTAIWLEFGPRSLLRRYCHAPPAGVRQSVFDDPTLALEPRQARSAQAGGDRSEPWSDRRRSFHFWLPQLPDRSARSNHRREKSGPYRGSSG